MLGQPVGGGQVKWKPPHAIAAGAPGMAAGATKRSSDSEAASAKRSRLLQHVARHGLRKVTMALESTLPAEITWGLSAVLQASCGLEGNATSEKLEQLVHLQRNPSLLPALLALALPEPPEDPYDVLRPRPPEEAQLRALGKLHRRQAWLALRNMSLVAENEPLLLQSAPLRTLLLHTLQRGFHEADPLPPLTLAALEAAESADDGATESAPAVHSGRGRGRGRGGYGARGRQLKQAEEARGASSAAASTVVINAEASSGPGREVPLLSEEYEPRIHAAAAEVLSAMSRQARLDDLLVRLPADAAAASSVPESVPELCCLLAQLLRCGEAALSQPAVEAVAKFAAVDHNEAHLHAMFAAEPSLAAVFVGALEPDEPGGAPLPADERARLQEAALDVLCVFSSAALPLRLHLARERSLIPLLISLLCGATPPPASRRAGTVLLNLLGAPGNHSAIRPYEGVLAGLAMHPPGEAGANQDTKITEIMLELNPTPAW